MGVSFGVESFALLATGIVDCFEGVLSHLLGY